ncbi:hypothetical protein LTR84_001937 [Exophiala bonariae]|uniref:Zn(2)-C6 fungal-type domain-containing protein n=1 Tax=Exophiala bonariae TaxID=1690606 RepID=A0AAV9NCW0_9EURO|nr:hypothetical protein LTR84_001937 [Exophiala bonariae]
MVYDGKPSRACLPCRRRKLRCDLKRDSCGQCIRAGLDCTGYRNPHDLRIQNETKLVKRKVLEAKNVTVSRFGEPSLQQKSRGAFLSHYVHGISGSYDVIALFDNASLDTHLDASINAASLAFFHFQYFSPRASDLARKGYYTALKLVNVALQNPNSLASDSTLLAVLLLDLFEKFTNSNSRSSVAWMSHVNGALALIKLRDSIQFQTYIGRRLSFRLATSLLISCVAGSAPVPPALRSLRAELENYVNVEDPKWKLTDLSIKSADLKAAIHQGLLSNEEKILQSKQLDSEFSSLSANMPATWLSQRKYLERPSQRVFGQFYDLYPSYFVTQTRNVIRLTRIVLNHEIRTLYKAQPLDIDTTTEAIQLTFIDRIIDDIAREICASGPQFTGAGESLTPNKKATDSVQKFFCHTLLFPFYVAGLYASPGSMIRPWVLNQLRYIAKEFEVRHAATVADILDSEEPKDPWSVYAILGSYAFAS